MENHEIRIFEKLGVRTQAHAVTVASAYGLTRTPAQSEMYADEPVLDDAGGL